MNDHAAVMWGLGIVPVAIQQSLTKGDFLEDRIDVSAYRRR